jgi:ribosomal protein S18 acetylase RimI-like enzyme
MEGSIYRDRVLDSTIQEYKSGHSSDYTDAGHDGLSIETGDTCNVVGGKSYVVREENGHRLASAWPDIYGDTGYASLAADSDSLNSILDSRPRLIETKTDVPGKLVLADYDTSLAEQYLVEVDEEKGEIRQEDSTYKQVQPEQFKQMYEIMSKVFHYDGPPNSLLNLFSSTGGHVGGIYYGDRLAGFTTVAYATHQHLGEALFIDMVGVDPEFQGKGLGRFGLQACAVAATALGLSKVRLTYDGENKKLAQYYLSAGVQPVDYLSNVYGKGISRFLAELDLQNPQQRQRSIYGKKIPSILPGTPTISIPPDDYVFQTHAYQLHTEPERLIIADYDNQRGYIGYYNDTRT